VQAALDVVVDKHFVTVVVEIHQLHDMPIADNLQQLADSLVVSTAVLWVVAFVQAVEIERLDSNEHDGERQMVKFGGVQWRLAAILWLH